MKFHGLDQDTSQCVLFPQTYGCSISEVFKEDVS